MPGAVMTPGRAGSALIFDKRVPETVPFRVYACTLTVCATFRDVALAYHQLSAHRRGAALHDAHLLNLAAQERENADDR